jgi:putative chitinase
MLADAGQFDKITLRINVGQSGTADRQVLYVRALKVLV